MFRCFKINIHIFCFLLSPVSPQFLPKAQDQYCTDYPWSSLHLAKKFGLPPPLTPPGTGSVQVGFLKMEKGSHPQESTPPYPGPPMDYGQPEMYAPPTYSTQPGYPAAPAGRHGGVAFGKRIPPTGICTTKPWPSNGPGSVPICV